MTDPLRQIKLLYAAGISEAEARRRYDAAQADTLATVKALRAWVNAAEKSLSADKLDGMARARLGELLIAAIKYFADREKAAKALHIQAQTENP